MTANQYPTLEFDLGDTAEMLRDTVRSFASDKNCAARRRD